ncbi:hypothetical protein IFM89_029743 [Coptis chinensis]|uniref:Uncharacterized protein n=1 Tax=Coptis chinensis TaxID=261450 RepID=A0A835LXL2_9MAGN|nr:hypothetical protein IFM89_029743 [Coptis chinensis]
MWPLLAAVKRKFGNIRKSSRVADENMFGEGNDGAELHHEWNFLSVLETVVQGPLLLFSCVAQPQVTGADGMWVHGEYGRFSEINHLMVNDGMRYAILM